jgi:NADPH:quinone reductase-like Zn-dependent oxidoreductase
MAVMRPEGGLTSGSNKRDCLVIWTTAFIFGELTMVGVRGCGRRNQELCMRLLGEGKIKPVIDKAFPLSQATQTHAHLESRACRKNRVEAVGAMNIAI